MESLFEAYKKMKEAAAVCPKCGANPCKCDSVDEALKGNQVKLDKNKNGKLDSEDFKKLRKEEQEPPFDKPYTVVKNTKNNGAVKARALAQKALKTAIIQGHEKYTSSPDKLKPKHFGMSEDFTDVEIDDMINEVLSKDAKAGDWISDFIHSDNPKFAGKSDKKRKEMALAAYYAKQRNEEVELTEGYEEIKVHSKDGKHIGTITHGKYQSVAYAHPTTKFGGSKEPHPDEDSTTLAGPHETQKGIDFIHAHHRMMSEEVEQLDELSPKTLGSYIKKAKGSAIGSSQVMGMGSKMTGQKTQDKAEKTVEKRAKGINKAVDRLTREETEYHIEDYSLEELQDYMMSEDFEQLDELSKTTLGNYVKKAARDSTISRKIASDFEHMAARAKKPSSKSSASELEQEYKSKSWKRRDNVNKAVDRLTKEEFEQIEEGEEKIKYVSGHGWGPGRVQVTTNKGRKMMVKHEITKDHSYTGPQVGHKMSDWEHNKEEHMKSFKEFIEEAHEYKAGRYVHKGTYGTSHDDPGVKSKPFWQSADKDEDDKPKKAEAPAVKRGRGRPAGAKSGARQFGAASKDGSGADYTGYKLHLPNSNK